MEIFRPNFCSSLPSVPTLEKSLPRVPISLQHSDLPKDYQPRDCDILCGRGRGNWNHEGNKRFKKVIEAAFDRYLSARNKTEKSMVVSALVDSLRQNGVMFVKRNTVTKRWYEIDENGRQTQRTINVGTK